MKAIWKCSQELRVLPVLLLLWLPIWPGGWVRASTDPPEEVVLGQLRDLYEPVLFDHQTHSENYGCSICHHHTTGESPEEAVCRRCHEDSPGTGEVRCSSCHKISYAAPPSSVPPVYHIDIPRLKGALHLRCLNCHLNDGGPVGCLECHPFQEKGKSRFYADLSPKKPQQSSRTK